MPNSPPKLYWDANVFLAYVSAETERLPDVEALLDGAEKGDVEIYTSELSVVEVAYATQEKAGGALDPQIEMKIEALWRPPSPIRRVEFNSLISRDARGIIRTALSTDGAMVKPADSIHLATAQRYGVDEIHTYESLQRRERWAGLVGIDVKEPWAAQPQLTPQNPIAQGEGPN